MKKVRGSTFKELLRGTAFAVIGMTLTSPDTRAQQLLRDDFKQEVAGARCVAGAIDERIRRDRRISRGRRTRPSAAFGLMYSRFLNPSQAIDVTIIRQSTTLATEEGSVIPEVDFDIEYYHVGGRYVSIRHKSKFRPYVSMSLGVSRFVASPGGSEAGFSVGFGGGSDVTLSQHVALRFDARLFTTIALSSGLIYCESETCTVFASGGAFAQFAGTAGIVFKF